MAETHPTEVTNAGQQPRFGIGAVAVIYGAASVLYILGNATLRLGFIAADGVRVMPLPYWIPTLAWMGFNAYAEGYRGFHQAFAPRLAARAALLVRQPTLLRCLLAPLFLMGLVDGTRKRMTVGWTLVAAIAGLVTIVRGLPQPYRGMVDAGVVVGLGLGIASVVVHLVRLLSGVPSGVDPEVAN